ncbi:MAG: hypothetical protein ACYC8T_36245 [Myxococcaceae bacterium]
MHGISRKWQAKFLAIVAPALMLGFGVAARADEEHKHGAPLQGGKVAMTEAYHFEVVFAKDGMKVFPRTHDDEVLDVKGLDGTATFYHPNSPRPWFQQKLTPKAAGAGLPATYLGSSVNLSKVPTKGAKVTFKITGLPDAAEPLATFTVPFALAASGELVVTKATKADEKAIAALKTCPVSKEDLGSMGGPLKVSRGDKSTFICCKSCLKELQANPDKFFGATASAAKGEHDAHDHKH